MAKRKTSAEEYERIAERIYSHHRRSITNAPTFEIAFNKELDISEFELTEGQKKLRQMTLSRYKKVYPENFKEQKRQPKIEKKPEKKAPEKKRHDFNRIGKVRGRIVYSYKSSVEIKGKSFVRFRDKRGRFVAVKKR